jgi:hypothetical protein
VVSGELAVGDARITEGQLAVLEPGVNPPLPRE